MIDNRNNPAITQQEQSPIKRHTIINDLISKYKYTKYLEIGIFDGYTFKNVRCSSKHGVEPGAEGLVIQDVTHRMTSDKFFDSCDKNEKYDIVLIDGLHEYKQVIKDFNNSLQHISNNGHILLHDCHPVDELCQKVPRESITWNGDVWKAFVLIKQSNPHAFVYDTDFGIGVIHNDRPLTPVTSCECDMTWSLFYNNKQDLLGLRSYEQ